MQHVNRYNGLQGSFDYITESEVVHDYQIDEYEEETYFPATFTGTESDLIADIDNSKEVHYDNHGELNVTHLMTDTYHIRNISFGDLEKDDIHDILKDGRLASHFLERQLEVWYPHLTFC